MTAQRAGEIWHSASPDAIDNALLALASITDSKGCEQAAERIAATADSAARHESDAEAVALLHDLAAMMR